MKYLWNGADKAWLPKNPAAASAQEHFRIKISVTANAVTDSGGYLGLASVQVQRNTPGEALVSAVYRENPEKTGEATVTFVAVTDITAQPALVGVGGEVAYGITTDPPGYEWLVTYVPADVSTPGVKTVTAVCGNSSAQCSVTVVGIKRVICEEYNVSSETDDPDEPETVYVAWTNSADEYVELIAVPEPNVPWPEGRPVWEGAEQDAEDRGKARVPRNKATLSVEESDVRASCGTSAKAARVIVARLNLEYDNLPEEWAVMPDEPNELVPGGFLGVNDNDNAGGTAPGQGNATPDNQDPTPLAHADPDLRPIRITIQPSDLEHGVAILNVPDESGPLRAWADGKKNATPKTWDFDEGARPPAEIYLEGYAPASAAVSLAFEHGEKLALADTVNMTVLSVDLLHDIYGDLQALEDWPQSGSQLRSPKFIFGKEDGVFVRISGPDGLGNSFFKARVTSQSDATGIELDLREVSSGIYMNSDADNERLRLAVSTAEGSPADTIKVVEEEVLTVAISAGGSSPICTKDVMVDRGEYAAAGDANWPGDTRKFKSEMVNARVDWSEAGYNDAFGPASVAAFRAFIKSAGSGSSDHGEADMLYYTAHGDYDGTLYAHPPSYSSAILDGYDIANGSDWNNDLEWFYSDACSSLHNASQVGFLSGCTDDGYLGWTAALFGNPRPAHMVLGHWAPVNDQWSWKGWGNSQAICDDFFDHAAASSPDTIVISWLHANTDLFADQECVVVAHADNVADQLKTVTRDTSSTAMKYYWYDPTGIGGTWHDTDFTKSFPAYNATETTIPDVTPFVSKRQMVPMPFLTQETRGKYRSIKRIQQGTVSALLQSPSEISDSASAWAFLKGELSVTQELAGISQVSVGTFSEGDFTWGENQFHSSPRVVGRLYKWSHNIDGVPVYGDEVSLLVIEGRPTKLRACWHQEAVSPPVTSQQRAVNPTSLVSVVRTVMQQASPPFEKITKTGMGYYTFQDAGKSSKEALPVWMFQVENATRKRTLYFNAMTGSLIDSRRDLSAAAGSPPQGVSR